MVHFTTLAIAYLSDRIKRVNQSFCQAPTDLFDLFEIAVRNELDWRIFVDNSGLRWESWTKSEQEGSRMYSAEQRKI
ncbi:hypothetical protein, partial [Collinsella bouchesdurhonensis]|uniref:hypothetical protein n=1 Tax=Collinsella bouchesdurhonensis TaxID=1907654 RepID=UPI0035697C8B